MRGFRTLSGLAVLAIVAALLTSAPAVRGQPASVKIYSSLPQLGAYKEQTAAIVNAIKMALDEAGSQVDGVSVSYVELNDSTLPRGGWDARKEAANARRAANDPEAVAYIGPFTTGAAKIAIPILSRAGLAMVNPANSYPGLTKEIDPLPGNEPEAYYPTGVRNYARVIPTDDVQGAVGASWAQQLGAQRVYVLQDDTLFGQVVAGGFTRAAQQLGLQVVGGPETVDPQSADYHPLAFKVRAAKPDLIYFGGTTQNSAAQLVGVLRQVLGSSVKLMGSDGIYNQTFLDEAGDAANGVYVTWGLIPPEMLTGKGAEWYAAYQGRYQTPPGAYAAYGYEAARVVLDAIHRAATKDRDGIRAAIMATQNFDGILGTWSFDQNGDTTLTRISGRQVQDGEFDETHAVLLDANPAGVP